QSATANRRGSALDNFRPDAFVGENFQQQAVRQAAVDEVYALHALGERADGAADLRAHALVDDALFLQIVDLADLERGNKRGGVGGIGEEAGHVAHVDEAAGTQGAGHAAGDEVGVHIIGFAVVAFRHRRNHRNKAVGDFLFDQLHLHLSDFADVAEIDRVAVVVGRELLADKHGIAGESLGLG